MLKFWHASFLVLIALIWKVRPVHSYIDVCDLGNSNVSMYCSCEPMHRNDMGITCYVVGPVSANNRVWSAFRDYPDTVALVLQPRISTHLDYVPIRAFQSLPSLENLRIQEASLMSLPAGVFSDMPNLRNLRLERNEIVDLERYSISNLPKLKKLTLSENGITKILADAFSRLDDLEELYLDRNNITFLEECAFCNLHSLKELELWRNGISELSERTFLGLRYLRRLDLFNNELRVLGDKVFHTLPRLSELDLKNNLIQHISPDAFYGLQELTILRLANNQLKTLPDGAFRGLPKLMLLDVSLNKLETVQVELVESMKHALNNHFMFSFKNNPLKCSCEFFWLSVWIHKAKHTRFGQELLHVKCQDKDGEEKLVHELKTKACEKKPKSREHVPTVATLHARSEKQPTSLNPKYDSEYSDATQNHTEYVFAATLQPLREPTDDAVGPPGANLAVLLFGMAIVACLRT